MRTFSKNSPHAKNPAEFQESEYAQRRHVSELCDFPPAISDNFDLHLPEQSECWCNVISRNPGGYCHRFSHRVDWHKTKSRKAHCSTREADRSNDNIENGRYI